MTLPSQRGIALTGYARLIVVLVLLAPAGSRAEPQPATVTTSPPAADAIVAPVKRMPPQMPANVAVPKPAKKLPIKRAGN